MDIWERAKELVKHGQGIKLKEEEDLQKKIA